MNLQLVWDHWLECDMQIKIELKPTVKFEKEITLKVKIVLFLMLIIPFGCLILLGFQAYKRDALISVRGIEYKKTISGILKKHSEIKKIEEHLFDEISSQKAIKEFISNNIYYNFNWSLVLDEMKNSFVVNKNLRNCSLQLQKKEQGLNNFAWHFLLTGTNAEVLSNLADISHKKFGNLKFRLISNSLDPSEKRKLPLEIKLTGSDCTKKYSEGQK
jgi:hypothetical protein